MALITAAEYKAFAGITTTALDDKIDLILPWVEDAIKTYTDRDFGETEAPATRTYRWDGRGAVEIDDCADIDLVTLDGRTLTEGTDYVPGPDRDPVYTWLEIAAYRRRRSPEMGFTWNEDIYGPLVTNFPADVAVTATFGWEEVPGAVKLAATWMASDLIQSTPLENLQSEAIDSYARSWASEGEDATTAIPQRALWLLDPYVRRASGAA